MISLNRPAAFCFVILIMLICSPFISSQEQFEGKIDVKLVYDGEESYMDYLVKGTKFRMELKGEDEDETSIILSDLSEHKMMILMPSNKMYMEYSMKSAMEEVYADSMNNDANIQHTGETKEINGYLCEKLIYEDNPNTEVWVASNLGTFMMFNNPMMNSDQPDWYSDFNGQGFFPILVIEKDDSGEEESRWEVTKVEEKSLNADLFVPPADYEKMEMPMINMEDLIR
jgi:hypothetical protein